MREDTKLARIRSAMKEEDWDTALKLAGHFPRLGEQKDSIKLAAESITNPEFYRHLGYDPEVLKSEGIDALKIRFSNSWNEVKNQKK